MADSSDSTTAPKTHHARRQPPWEHPLDRIFIASQRVAGIAAVTEYAMQKDAQYNDGPQPSAMKDALSVINSLAREIEAGVHELQSDYVLRKGLPHEV